MDNFLYIAMNASRTAELAQQTNANNLANVNSIGFKAELDYIQSIPVYGPGHATRVYASNDQAGIDLTQGPVLNTGRDLDVVINEQDGWLAVQAEDGSTAFTRRGDLHIDANGLVTNGSGDLLLGEGGPITLPQFESLVIGRDGTLSIRAAGQSVNTLVAVDRIRMVKLSTDNIQRGEDGLFRVRDGIEPIADASITLTSGALEGSNVNSIDAMVRMLEYSRNYETSVKLMKVAEDNDASSARLMRLNG